MSVELVSIKIFKDKIKNYIPFHEINSLPRIGDVEGQKFECGCSKDHVMNFDQHYFIADGGMFKAIFLSPACGFLNVLKLKKMFSSDIENLFSTKFLSSKKKYGFDDYPNISGAIEKYLNR